MPQTRVKVTQKDGEFVEAGVLATSVREISRGVKKLLAGGLNRSALVILIAESSGVYRADVRKVLDGLTSLESDWCNPVKS